MSTIFDYSLIDSIDNSVEFDDVLHAINSLDAKTKQYIYKLLFCKLISDLDHSISEMIRKEILNTDTLKQKYSIQILHKQNDENCSIEEHLTKESFLNGKKVVKLFRKIFEINLEENIEIENARKKRNTFIHRDGRNNYRKKLLVSPKELLALQINIKNYFSEVRNAIIDKHAQIIVQKQNNTIHEKIL